MQVLLICRESGLAKIDETEDRRFGRDKRGDELPEELAFKEKRLAKIRAAKEALERRKAEEEGKEKPKDDDGPPKASPKPTDQLNFTDPDSRIMVDSHKSFIQAYNAQAAVDSQCQIIIGHDVTNESNDKKQVKPNLQATPERLSADAGYCSENNVHWLIQERIAP